MLKKVLNLVGAAFPVGVVSVLLFLFAVMLREGGLQPVANPGATLTPDSSTATPTLAAGYEYVTVTPPPYPFVSTGITATQNTNALGCNWMGVSGQVDEVDSPGVELVVHLEGNGQIQEFVVGRQPELAPNGYEFTLGDRPAQTQGIYRIQLRDTNQQPLSYYVGVSTSASCDQNRLIVDFIRWDQIAHRVGIRPIPGGSPTPWETPALIPDFSPTPCQIGCPDVSPTPCQGDCPDFTPTPTPFIPGDSPTPCQIGCPDITPMPTAAIP